jgi:hypothetical protein
MPYLVNASREQISQELSSGTVRTSWTFGNLIPDFIQVFQAGDPPVQLARVPINKGTKSPTSTEFVVVAPSFLSIVISPRTVQGDTFNDRMADDSGNLQYWETFSLTLPLLTVAASSSGQPDNRGTPKPVIVNVEIREGEFTVHWASASVDHFNVIIAPSIVPFQGQVELEGSDRSLTQKKVPGGRTYRVSIQGCTQAITRSNCSEWVATDIVVPLEMGYKLWKGPVAFGGAHLSPGAPVSVFQQSPGVWAGLTVDRNGMMNVTWADFNVSTPRWEDPVAFGGAYLVPGAPVSVFQQSPGVWAGVTVDTKGMISVAWADFKVREPRWEGPVQFGEEATLFPGAPVSVFQQSPAVWAGLTVGRNEMMNVMWADFN